MAMELPTEAVDPEYTRAVCTAPLDGVRASTKDDPTPVVKVFAKPWKVAEVVEPETRTKLFALSKVTDLATSSPAPPRTLDHSFTPALENFVTKMSVPPRDAMPSKPAEEAYPTTYALLEASTQTELAEKQIRANSLVSLHQGYHNQSKH